MNGIGNIIIVSLKKIKYGNGLGYLLPRSIKNPQLEGNTLTQTAVSIQAKINYGEVNYYYNRVNMD